mmetsp:Transcript_137578/g.252334  ORF Transcript_137578/g.252334 Transcript_137578/m.252334 type:complete len:628 (-) Transcript_137578:194-2077(-)
MGDLEEVGVGFQLPVDGTFAFSEKRQFQSVESVTHRTPNFHKLLRSQLATLHHVLLMEHKREMSSLREKKHILEEQVSTGEAAGAVKHELLMPEVPTSCNQVECSAGDDDVGGQGTTIVSMDDIWAFQNVGQDEQSEEEDNDDFWRQRPSPQSHVTDRTTESFKLEKTLTEADARMERKGSLQAPVDPAIEGERARTSFQKRGRTASHVIAKQTISFADPDTTLLGRLVHNRLFEITCGAVILISTLLMALQVEYEGFDIGVTVKAANAKSSEDTWPGAERLFLVCENVFNVIFVVELVFRIAAGRMAALRSWWIRFDFAIITMSVVDTLGSTALPVNPSMLRMMRLLRMLRLFRILKAMKAFDSLFLLLKSIYSSMHAAVWSFFFLTAVHVIAGLFLCQVLQGFMNDVQRPLEVRQKVYNYFGTMTKSMFTMFEISMANWAGPCRVLVDEVSEWYIPLIILYRCFFLFAVLKVIAAVFITETNSVLAHDDELTLMKRHREQASFRSKVKQFVHSIDSFDEESVCWQDLEEIVSDEDVAALLAPLGFAPKDLEKIFWLIDDGTGHMHVDEFLAKIGSFRGHPKTVDLMTLLKLTHNIDRKVQYVFHEQGLLDNNVQDTTEADRVCRV